MCVHKLCGGEGLYMCVSAELCGHMDLYMWVSTCSVELCVCVYKLCAVWRYICESL